jgi:hypothetical protein
MTVFKRGFNDKKIVSVDKDSVPTNDGSFSDTKSSPSIETIKEGLTGRGRGRISNVEKAKRAEEENLIEQAKKLYTAEQWAPIASLYFDTRYLMTKYEQFLLSKEQSLQLGTSLALVMQTLIKIDPKYVALVVFSVQMGNLIINKELDYTLWKKKQKNL